MVRVLNTNWIIGYHAAVNDQRQRSPKSRPPDRIAFHRSVVASRDVGRRNFARLFEAARWAPSSFNAQQWRALYARRGTEHWETFFDLLVDANKAWAKNAAVLIVFISRKKFEHDEEPSITHSYDAGAAWENFALQGFHQGLVVHGMQGFA